MIAFHLCKSVPFNLLITEYIAFIFCDSADKTTKAFILEDINTGNQPFRREFKIENLNFAKEPFFKMNCRA